MRLAFRPSAWVWWPQREAELQIQQAGVPLLNLPVAQLAAQFEQAIPRRMGVDLPPTA